MLKWGDSKTKLDFYYQLLKQGKIVNEEDMEPDIGPFYYYIECFNELQTCRSGMAISPIPFTAILKFVAAYNIEDLDEFLYYIRRLDKVYLDHQARKDGTGNTN